jgi:hypothetical protein
MLKVCNLYVYIHIHIYIYIYIYINEINAEMIITSPKHTHARELRVTIIKATLN